MRQPTLEQFREQIEQALGDAGVQLGLYHWPLDDQGGLIAQQTPALFVGEPPEGVTVEGLEVLIPETPEMKVIPTFAGAVTIDTYPVRAVSHDGRSLKPVWEALANAFKGVQRPEVLQATDRYPDQIVIRITP